MEERDAYMDSNTIMEMISFYLKDEDISDEEKREVERHFTAVLDFLLKREKQHTFCEECHL